MRAPSAERLVAKEASTWASTPGVVLSGTFHRERSTLQADAHELQTAGCRVLSPLDLTFVAERDGFVLAEHELEESPAEIEERHLAAVARADFVWLHCPDGYLGLSGSLEIGYAKSLGIPVFARERPREVPLGAFVTVCATPAQAVYEFMTSVTEAAPSTLRSLQRYYARAALDRGYEKETAQESLLLLTEEIGELARAIRREAVLPVGTEPSDHSAALELADVQLYVLHLANVLDVDLGAAVRDKERINRARQKERIHSPA